MNIQALLNPVNCSCGKTHRCDIKHVYIGKNVISRLAEMCEGYNNILILADENTYAVAGEKCSAVLCNKNLRLQIFSGKTVLIPDEAAISAVENQLSDIELIIGIGSGVIQDLSKYISYFHKIPYYIVATAPSMDGYASSGAAMITGGMKVTYSAKVPDGFIGDTAVLKDAPLEMIKAGYGDILGKYSALCDWKLSNLIYGEFLCDYIYNLTFDMIREVLPLAKRLLSRDEEAVGKLTEALIAVGIAMAYAENSRPASGSEHHLSHYFEITGILNNEKYLAHGIDVAYSTYITALIREKLADVILPEKQYKMETDEYESEMKRVYTDISDSCIALH
ncbi:MAG: sn-glycerol-1-phosphate dehydrogenase, partial [Clostridia bacterium]|nr:sn-glycerol-1-phosphate dehydrogenase [Clostridia bacterium]